MSIGMNMGVKIDQPATAEDIQLRQETAAKAALLAAKVLLLSRNTLLFSMRFLDRALCAFTPILDPGLSTLATDGQFVYYNPLFILKAYQANPRRINRLYLHLCMHCIFQHPFIEDPQRKELWDLACDMAVEGAILELALPSVAGSEDDIQRQEMEVLREELHFLTAEKLYRHFLDGKVPDWKLHQWNALFRCDDHHCWYVPPEIEKAARGREKGEGRSEEPETAKTRAELKEEWREIAERVEVDLKTISKDIGDGAGNFILNIRDITKEKYDYTEFLRKFAVRGEEIQINDDEFDYVFYTYGLRLYQNMPLVEPLEYKEVEKIREFVIAIDTSGSLNQDAVQKFIQKTYNILSQTENFFRRINIHIIQCDAQIQEEVKITSPQEFEEYIARLQLRGFGGTDFCPVFERVDQMIASGEFQNLKGLIYFTDGYGNFPKKKPGYDAAFILARYGPEELPPVPVWAMRIPLDIYEFLGGSLQ
ncbi:MAG TPA: VWA-like domain-containing protein [Syntrophomonas sp.]|nr:VWA-like domain-containing protein [Syntrophomonas sp.]